MTRWITSAKLIALGAFLVASLLTVGYEYFYAWPEKKCDASGAWWDMQDRQCLTPIAIWRITGRGPITGPDAVAAKAAASGAQRLAAGAQSTSPAPPPLANRAATNSKSDNRLR